MRVRTLPFAAAPPDTPHLHFAINQLNPDRHWWQGRALDPYEVFRR
jgi:hypothetical protein